MSGARRGVISLTSTGGANVTTVVVGRYAPFGVVGACNATICMARIRQCAHTSRQKASRRVRHPRTPAPFCRRCIWRGNSDSWPATQQCHTTRMRLNRGWRRHGFLCRRPQHAPSTHGSISPPVGWSMARSPNRAGSDVKSSPSPLDHRA